MPDRLTNVAVGRPTEMQTTEGKFYSYKAVDGNRNGRLTKGSCARTKKFKEPWWRVDLGNKVWVEKVLIANRDDCCHKELSNVEIRVGKRCKGICLHSFVCGIFRLAKASTAVKINVQGVFR